MQILHLKQHAHFIINYSNSYTTINTPYNWPAFLAASCLNIGYLSLPELIRIHN